MEEILREQLDTFYESEINRKLKDNAIYLKAFFQTKKMVEEYQQNNFIDQLVNSNNVKTLKKAKEILVQHLNDNEQAIEQDRKEQYLLGR